MGGIRQRNLRKFTKNRCGKKMEQILYFRRLL